MEPHKKLADQIDDEERTRLAELIRRCEVSRETRLAYADILRLAYEYGSREGQRAKYNKIYAHLNRVSSFVFAPGNVRFGVHLPPSQREAWTSAAAVARDEFRQTWSDAGADTVLDMALEWALVLGGVGIKLMPDPGTHFRLCYVNPWDLGVSREDVGDLDEQDVLCHWYTLSVPQAERWVYGEPDASKERLLTLIDGAAKPARSTTTSARLVVSSITGTFPNSTLQGAFAGEPKSDSPPASQVEEPTVEFVDVWERRTFRAHKVFPEKSTEVFEDWLVTTLIAAVQEPLVQRRNPDLPRLRTGLNQVLPAELPFDLLTPRPLPDYLWGRSELSQIMPLQEWMEEHLSSIKGIVERQCNPPKFFSGVADWEEAGRAMETAGGSSGSAEPGSKMDALIPTLTPQAMDMLTRIGSMFEDISGVPGSITEPGQTPGGVRSTGHFSMAAGIGAGRLLKMALVIEETMGSVATKAFHLMQRHSTDAYSRPDGPKFLLSQLPHAIRFLVNAHSAAPIFSEQVQAKAAALQRAGAISGEDYVELLDPPNREELKVSARKLAESKSEMTQEAMRIQEEKALKAKIAPKGKS